MTILLFILGFFICTTLRIIWILQTTCSFNDCILKKKMKTYKVISDNALYYKKWDIVQWVKKRRWFKEDFKVKTRTHIVTQYTDKNGKTFPVSQSYAYFELVK